MAMNTPPRRSTRVCRPVERLTAESTSDGFISTIGRDHDFVQVTRIVLEEHDSNSTRRALHEQRRTRNQSITVPTFQQDVQVKIRPFSLVQKRNTHRSLTATLVRPAMDKQLQQGEVRVKLAQCSAVSRVLAATPLVARLDKNSSRLCKKQKRAQRAKKNQVPHQTTTTLENKRRKKNPAVRIISLAKASQQVVTATPKTPSCGLASLSLRTPSCGSTTASLLRTPSTSSSILQTPSSDAKEGSLVTLALEFHRLIQVSQFVSLDCIRIRYSQQRLTVAFYYSFRSNRVVMPIYRILRKK
jgi:hypothetical protein